MGSAKEIQPKHITSGGRDYVSPNAQYGVNGANGSLIDEAHSDEFEEDEYDDDQDDSLNPFAHPPHMPPYDFAKRKLSQLIGTGTYLPKDLSSLSDANM